MAKLVNAREHNADSKVNPKDDLKTLPLAEVEKKLATSSYGFLMTPLGWGWALFVWGYALAWFLVNDRVELLAYRILDAAKAKET